MIQRIVFGLLYVVFVLIGTTDIALPFLQSIISPNLNMEMVFSVFIAILAILCVWEAGIMMKYDNKALILITLLVTCIPIFLFWNPFINGGIFLQFKWEYVLYVFAFSIVLFTIFKYPDELTAYDTSKLIFIALYIGVPLALLFAIPNMNSFLPDKPKIGLEVFYLFVLIWVSDSMAYGIGKYFGKRKWVPKISPNKTIEGLAAGILFTLISGVIIEIYNPDLRGNWIIIGCIVAVFAPLGDLANSKLKRTFQVKDSGKLLPGHGGILDRLDSLLGTIPFVFLYYIVTV